MFNSLGFRKKNNFRIKCDMYLKNRKNCKEEKSWNGKRDKKSAQIYQWNIKA